MAVRIKSEKSSSVGSVLAGLAALITAVAGFIAVVHPFKKDDPKPPIVNADTRPPTQISNPEGHTASSDPFGPVGRGGQAALRDQAQRPQEQKAFDIDDYWTGVSDEYRQKFELFLHTEDDGRIVGTLLSGTCRDDGKYVFSISITSIAWDGAHLEVSLQWPPNPLYGHDDAARDASISLKVKNDSLTGTYHQKVYEGLTLNRGKADWCSK